MRLKVLKAWVVLLGLWLLAGCSALRVAYDNGPMLAWWWIDGYADFGGEQADRVKDDIHRWFGWHRTTQLPAYAAWLARTRGRIGDSITPAEVCGLRDEVRQLLDPAVDRALLGAAGWVPGLSDAQLRSIERRQAKSIDDARREFLQPDPAERRAAAVKRAVERAETLYGTLDEAQRRLVGEGVDGSPFDAEAWIGERLRRQRDTVQTLRRLVAERADRDAVVAALRALAERSERSPDPAHRAYQQRVARHNCALSARIHNAIRIEQRLAARERLRGWEDDLRALTGAAPAVGGAVTGRAAP